MTRVLRSALVALLVLVPAAAAQAAPLTTPCGGRAMTPDKVITGEFGTNLNKSYVMVPFDVPAGATAVRVKYCWHRPESGTQRHTLDLGLYEPRKPGDSVSIVFVDRTGVRKTRTVTLTADPHVDVVPLETSAMTDAQRRFRES